jgi:hypothetical protein
MMKAATAANLKLCHHFPQLSVQALQFSPVPLAEQIEEAKHNEIEKIRHQWLQEYWRHSSKVLLLSKCSRWLPNNLQGKQLTNFVRLPISLG